MALPTNRIKNPFELPKLGTIFQELFSEEFPRVNVSDKESSICVKAELPGMVKDDIAVEIEDFMLEIKGDRKNESIEEGETYYRKEIRSGSFSRIFQLPSSIDPEKVEASFKDGILTILIPKVDEAKPLKVKIK